jgi:hypothetical protein
VNAPRFTRRAALGLAAAGGAAYALRRGLYAERADAAGFLRRIVAFRVPYARVEAASFERFVHDYLQHDGWRLRRVLARMRAPTLYGRPRLHGLAAGPTVGGALLLAERHVVTALLLASGFFDGGTAAPGRTLAYGSWRPPCASPFARPWGPSAAPGLSRRGTSRARGAANETQADDGVAPRPA